jgi:hypothetical protein
MMNCTSSRTALLVAVPKAPDELSTCWRAGHKHSNSKIASSARRIGSLDLRSSVTASPINLRENVFAGFYVQFTGLDTRQFLLRLLIVCPSTHFLPPQLGQLLTID